MHRSFRFAVAGVLAAVSSGLHAQNLLANPSFDQNLAGWIQQNYNPQWNAADANGSGHSGSVRGQVPGGVPQGSSVLAQCVQVTPNAEYDFSFKTRIQQVGLLVGLFNTYESNDCTGSSLTGDSIYKSTGQPNVWLTTHRVVEIPANAHSALVALGATTQFGTDAAHTLFFDDVYFGPVAPTTCSPDSKTLCLDYLPGDGRFLVRARYSTVQSGGLQGDGNAISLIPQGVNRGGLFWFFSADNPEALVKVLDGCASTAHLWVFISAGTNVGVNLFIADTQTGAVAFFHNPDLGPFPAVQNIFGIPCP